MDGHNEAIVNERVRIEDHYVIDYTNYNKVDVLVEVVDVIDIEVNGISIRISLQIEITLLLWEKEEENYDIINRGIRI